MSFGILRSALLCLRGYRTPRRRQFANIRNNDLELENGFAGLSCVLFFSNMTTPCSTCQHEHGWCEVSLYSFFYCMLFLIEYSFDTDLEFLMYFMNTFLYSFLIYFCNYFLNLHVLK